MTRSVVVTGANRGIGLEFVKQYFAAGWNVIATCREPDSASDLLRLSECSDRCRIISLDVSDERSVDALAKELGASAIDVLVNNAGSYGPTDSTLDHVGYESWLPMLETNVAGPLRVSTALLPGLRRSRNARVIALSSLMGSIGSNVSGGSYLYRSTKAAMNAVFRSFAIDVRGEGVAVAVVHPGWVETRQEAPVTEDPEEVANRLRRGREILEELGGPRARLDVSTSVESMRALVERLDETLTGRFLNFDGAIIPW